MQQRALPSVERRKLKESDYRHKEQYGLERQCGHPKTPARDPIQRSVSILSSPKIRYGRTSTPSVLAERRQPSTSQKIACEGQQNTSR